MNTRIYLLNSYKPGASKDPSPRQQQPPPQSQPQSRQATLPATDDETIAALRAAPDAVNLRCIGKQTVYWTISESLAAAFSKNVNGSNVLFFNNQKEKSAEHTLTTRLIFKDDVITLAKIQEDGEVQALIELDRATLAMNIAIVFFVVPVRDVAQCEILSGRKQF